MTLRGLYIAMLLVLCSFKPAGCLKMDIVVLTDLSGSVEGHFNTIKKSLSVFINRFELDNNSIRIGITSFSTLAGINCPLTSDKFELLTAIYNMDNPVGKTNLSNGLLVAGEQLINERSDAVKMIVIVTDGDPDHPDNVLDIADQLTVFNDIVICGVLVENYAANEQYLKSICSEGCFEKTNYDEISSTIEKLDICL